MQVNASTILQFLYFTDARAVRQKNSGKRGLRPGVFFG